MKGGPPEGPADGLALRLALKVVQVPAAAQVLEGDAAPVLLVVAVPRLPTHLSFSLPNWPKSGRDEGDLALAAVGPRVNGQGAELG